MNNKAKIICGDVLETIKKFPDGCIDSVITSPPYWQLRDYGYPEQWGLEPRYEEYLEHLWSLMDEIYRVLKNTGTVWVNLGDSYSQRNANNSSNHIQSNSKISNSKKNAERVASQKGYAYKCLMLIPHRFVIGCIDRKWILRNDIIWAKRNAIPESILDRFSKKHEFFFFMVKNTKYYFDLDGIRDKNQTLVQSRKSIFGKSEGGELGAAYGRVCGSNENGKNPGDISDFWDIPTRPSFDKHYATFNTKLIDKPIIAGCPKNGIILDPFCGSGTTLVRAIQLDRRAIGIDGSAEYCEMAKRKIDDELNQGKLF